MVRKLVYHGIGGNDTLIGGNMKDKVKGRIERGKKARQDAVKILEQQGKKVPKQIKDRAVREAKKDDE